MSNVTDHVYAVVDDDDRLQTIFSTRDKAEDWLGEVLYPEYFSIVEVILDEEAKLKEKNT